MSDNASCFVKYMSTTGQRDKIMQALEFFPQCLAGVAAATGNDPAPLMGVGAMAGTYRAITRLGSVIPSCLSTETVNTVFKKDSGRPIYRDWLDVAAWVCDIGFGAGEAVAIGANFGIIKKELGRFGSHAVHVWYYGIVFRLLGLVHDMVNAPADEDKETTRKNKITLCSLLCWLGVALFVTNPAGPQTLTSSTTNPVLAAIHKFFIATSPKKLQGPVYTKGVFGSGAAALAFL